MAKASPRRTPTTNFSQVSVEQAKQAARLAAEAKAGKKAASPANVTFEPSMGKIEPYSFRPDALYECFRPDALYEQSE